MSTPGYWFRHEGGEESISKLKEISEHRSQNDSASIVKGFDKKNSR